MKVQHGWSDFAVRNLGPLGIVLTLLGILPSQVRADGFEVGGRFGYAVAMGKAAAATAADNNDLSDGIAGQVPLWIDLGYRFADRVFVGGYFQYGVGINGKVLDDSCTTFTSVDCSTQDLRLGAQVHVHALPGKMADPWFGFGFGYEWMSVNMQMGDTEASGTFHGFEFANFQAGLDVRVVGGFSLGPFVSVSLGQFGTSSTDCSGSGCGTSTSSSMEITDKAMHEWLLFGIRGVFAHSNRE